MFEVGKRYWAKNGDCAIKVLCVKRTKAKATFTVRKSDADRYFGRKSKFTKKLELVDVPSRDGRRREFVPRVSDRFPGCKWCITDEEVSPHVR